MFTIDKEYSLFSKNNYVSEYKDYREWCKHCVHFGSIEGNRYWLCSQDCIEITNVSFCGHCDKFSSNKKINFLKRWLLRTKGFQFKNKVK